MARTDMLVSAPERIRPWVSQLWVSHGAQAPRRAVEHVLPTGQMHLVFRLGGPALRILHDGHDIMPRTIEGPVLGGARSRFYAKAADPSVISIGAVLRPGASLALFRVSAAELAERHTPLADLVGADANTLHAQLAQAPNERQQLDLLCQWLTTRSSNASPVTPLVRHALAGLAWPGGVDALVRASHYSHRGFLAQFKQAAGLGPKRLARLMRFQRLLQALRSPLLSSLSDIALDQGFSDQAHMNREFRVMAGVTPQHYRRLAPCNSHHVSLGATW